jgi:hypothetical protein
LPWCRASPGHTQAQPLPAESWACQWVRRHVCHFGNLATVSRPSGRELGRWLCVSRFPGICPYRWVGLLAIILGSAEPGRRCRAVRALVLLSRSPSGRKKRQRSGGNLWRLDWPIAAALRGGGDVASGLCVPRFPGVCSEQRTPVAAADLVPLRCHAIGLQELIPSSVNAIGGRPSKCIWFTNLHDGLE